MTLPSTGQILRIYIGESDCLHHKPLYETIVLKAREMGLAGATVLRGAMGFGASSHLHTAKILRLSMDLPVLIEIVESPEKIAAFLPYVEDVVKEGLVTIEEIRIVKYHGVMSEA